MNKTAILTIIGAASVFAANADVKVNLAPGSNLQEVKVSHATIKDMLTTPRNQDIPTVTDTYKVNKNSFTIRISPDGPSRYSIDFAPDVMADFYAQPGENLTVDVTSLSPLTYTVSGTPLMDGMTYIDSKTGPILAEFNAARQQPNTDSAKMQQIVDSYNRVLKDYITENPANPAAVYALLELDGEDFLKGLSLLKPEAMMSMLYPIVELRKPMIEKQVEAERLQQEMQNGTYDAIDFKLKDLNGKEVSLRDYRGKWVILDFWGSWCIWCIKGFPHLKEVYEANKDRLEVIGIDCQDTEEAWRAACDKYQLPWVNVYNVTKEGSVDQLYGIQGFPTKIIISPKGKIMNITTGDDPSFYDTLNKLMNK
ncbi:MAG: AhpC/TSA family protein [Bacteroides sp.]|nr:AhpC/TSA family protein [Bacteroides sp.]